MRWRFHGLEKLRRAAWALLALLLLFAPNFAGAHLATRQSGTVYQVLSDLRGNVVGFVDASGAATNNPRYGAFGPFATPTLNAPSFSTRWRDPTGFYYFGGRYYDAAGGRFLSPDPSRFADSRNLYAYCGNDPINNCDPDGMLEAQLRNEQNQPDFWEVGKAQMQQFNADYQRMSDARSAGDYYTYDRLNAQLSGQISESISSAMTPFAVAAEALSPIHGLAYGLTGVIEGSRAGDLKSIGFGLVSIASVLPGAGELRALRPLSTETRALTRMTEAAKTPLLSPKVAATFEGMPTYGPVNQMLYRAEDAVNSTTYGRWYGLAKPDSAATAEQMYNVFQHGNNLTKLSTYKPLQGAMGWVGKVKGGTGYQVYFDVPRANVSLQGTMPLPQAGF
jgi:RHS repeat-associated protein